MTYLRTSIAATLVFAAGVAVAYAATDGFEAYTLESARRLKALRAPTAPPDLALDLVDAGRTSLSQVPGQVLLVDFIYTRCPTYCAALGSVYAQLKRRLAPEIASGAVRLVSISFDPRRDGPAELRAYRARYARDAAGWEIGRPAHPGDVPRWLESFGVVVIPDELGGYAHNAAVHIVGPGRRLVAIRDFTDIDGTVAAVREVLAGAARDPTVVRARHDVRHSGAGRNPEPRGSAVWIPDVRPGGTSGMTGALVIPGRPGIRNDVAAR